ncbi:MAG: hypothetical protein V1887_02415 [Candidatus Aenigmatarchaeota archaeon]
MSASAAGYSFAIIAGVMAALLFRQIIRQNFRKSKQLFVMALLMSTACFSGLEWGLWMDGQDMFRLIVYPAVPLDFFFAAWIGFAVWVGDKIDQRKLAIYWLFLLAAIFVIASYCMNCVSFAH